jgi:hypothetical protein
MKNTLQDEYSTYQFTAINLPLATRRGYVELQVGGGVGDWEVVRDRRTHNLCAGMGRGVV